MAFRNRKTVRSDLATQIAADAGLGPLLQATYGYRPKDFEGQSPVCTVESAFSFPQFTPSSDDVFGFVVIFWVDRTDAAAAEDLIDDLEFNFKEFMKTWDIGEIVQESEIDFEVLGKGQYVVERHFVQVGSTS